MSKEAFVTLATNDTYGLGALVLGRSLRRVSTSKQTVVLVTPDVSQKMKEELAQVFNLVVTVDTLDSGDAAHLALMARPELGVTFTKLHAWRLVQFTKCVFLDADTLVVQNCDELFEREEFSAAPDPGWPDCFNSGVFVFVPSEDTFKALLDFAIAHGSFDGGDQGLLNMFFKDWATADIKKHLPFIYNVVSSATYTYLPALKFFGSKVKIVHFLGSNKPWLRQSEASSSTPYQRAWWSIFREDVAGRLSPEMAGVAGSLARGEPEDWRREAWEAGDVDYLGRDSFDNIWKRICECVGITAQSPSAPTEIAPKLAPEKPAEPTPAAEKPTEAAQVTEELVKPTAETPAESTPPAVQPIVPATAVEKSGEPTEPVPVAEKPSEAAPEKPVEVAPKKPTEVAPEKPAEVAPEKPIEAAPEKPAEVAPGKPTEAALEKPAEATPEKPADIIKLPPAPEKPVEVTPAVEKPVEAATAPEAAATVLPSQKPAEQIPAKEKTAEPLPSADKPLESAPAAEKIVPELAGDKPAESKPAGEKPVELAQLGKPDKPAEIAPVIEKSAEPAPAAEKPVETAPIPEKPAETAPVPEKSAQPKLTEKQVEPKPTEQPTPPAESPAPEVCPLKSAPPAQQKPTVPEKPAPPAASAPQPAPLEPLSQSGEARIQPPLEGAEAPVCAKPGTPTVTPPSVPTSPQPGDAAPEVCKLQATPSQPATPPASSHHTGDVPVPPKRKQGKNGKSGKGKK